MYLFFNFPFTYKQNGKLVAKQELLIHPNGCFPEHVHVIGVGTGGSRGGLAPPTFFANLYPTIRNIA